MREFLKGFIAVAFAGTLLTGLLFLTPITAPIIRESGALMLLVSGRRDITAEAPRQKSSAELVAEAREKSSSIKALYMTADVANDRGAGATRLRKHLIALADTTEINALVIDVKEVCGPEYDAESMKELLDDLHKKNIWAIARIVAFKDASQILEHPEWYLARENPKAVKENACGRKQHLVAKNAPDAANPRLLWRDNSGGWWMDPASPEARDYLIGFAKRISDLGFDELQFDYIRFPSDGDVAQAVYPVWDGKTPKHTILKEFFSSLKKDLKADRPEIILSADLFGYVANQGEDQSIGQRLYDIAPFFDYVSFMVYPSHYYAGLILPPDTTRGLPAINYTVAEARNNPHIVVGRSLMTALDFLNPATASSTAISAQKGAGDILQQKTTTAAVRPWLEDFFHEQDRLLGRPHGATKVRMQIDAAEESGSRGWMLWNASNVYSEDALKKE